MKIAELIERHEKKVPYAYQDSQGYLTIGIGRLIDKRMGGRLREDEIQLMLANDIKEAWDNCAVYPWFLNLSDARKAACIDLMFNLGLTKFRGFVKFIAAMASQNWQVAGDELVDSDWYKQTGHRAVEIINLIKFEAWPLG